MNNTVNSTCINCEGGHEDTPGPQTIFVHLLSGVVTEVTGVTEVHTTDTQVILRREGDEPAVFRRREVYSACCERDGQPAPC